MVTQEDFSVNNVGYVRNKEIQIQQNSKKNNLCSGRKSKNLKYQRQKLSVASKRNLRINERYQSPS